MHRYVTLIWQPENLPSGRAAASTASALLEAPDLWTVPYQSDGVLVIHQPPPHRSQHIHVLADKKGVIIGSLFQRTDSISKSLPGTCLGTTETDRIVRSHGRHLVDNYWGSYLAVMRDPTSDSTSILRDPTGTLPCYYARISDLHLFFSDIEDLEQHVSISLSPNWPHLAARLRVGVGTMPLSRICGLSELEDITGGELVTISKQGLQRKALWTPARFCVEDGLEDEHKATEALRRSVLDVVHSLASEHSEILLRLSGGLDSSIVAGCLAQHNNPPHITCLNFYTANEGEAFPTQISGYNEENLAKVRRVIGSGSGDEREFARSVASRWGFRLVERERNSEYVDLRRLWKAPLAPRPSPYVLSIDEDDAELEYATARGATACFTGLAGDTVFYCTFRAIGAIDYAYLHPLKLRLLLRQVGLATALSGEPLARVFGKAIKYGLLRVSLPHAYDPLKQPHLLKDDIATSVQDSQLSHPWLDTPPLCPGKRNHVLGVAASVPFYHYVYHRERIAKAIHPLASQPVVESCLRIPTYVLLADAVSRGLARRAFRDILPSGIARRSVKGIPNVFYQRLVRKNVAFIKERLLEGLLVKQGLLDGRKVESYLREDQPFVTVPAYHILDYLACEAWLDQWTSRGRKPESRVARGGEASAIARIAQL